MSTNDACAGEHVVQTAAITTEQRWKKTEASGNRQQQPCARANSGPPDIRRRVPVNGDDAKLGEHLAERLTGSREDDEIPTVLQQQKRGERDLGQQRELGVRQPANLQREIHERQVDAQENGHVDRRRGYPK